MLHVTADVGDLPIKCSNVERRANLLSDQEVKNLGSLMDVGKLGLVPLVNWFSPSLKIAHSKAERLQISSCCSLKDIADSPQR